MDNLYTAPKTRSLEGIAAPPSLVTTGAIAASQVAGCYGGVVMLFFLFTRDGFFAVLLFSAIITCLSMLVAMVITVAYGALVNVFLDALDSRQPVWFCVAVLIPAALLALVAMITDINQLFFYAGLITAYGLPIAWIASQRLLNQEKQYLKVHSPLS